MTLDKPIETDPCMTLESEDDAEFNRHVDDWIDQFRPETPFETQVIRHAAAVSWELDVAGRYEKACRIERIGKAVSACATGSRDQIEHAKARASFDPSMEGERLRRHQTSLRRELRRDLELFAKPRLQSVKSNPKQALGAGLPTPPKPPAAFDQTGERDGDRPNFPRPTHRAESEGGSWKMGLSPSPRSKPPAAGPHPEDRGLTPNGTAFDETGERDGDCPNFPRPTHLDEPEGGSWKMGLSPSPRPTPPTAGLHPEEKRLTPPARQSVLGAGLPTPPTPPTAGLHPEEKRPTAPARQFSFGADVPTPLRPPAESVLAAQLQPRSSGNRKARRPDPERLLREIRTGRRTKRVINPPPAAKLTEMLNVSASGPNWTADGGSSGLQTDRSHRAGSVSDGQSTRRG